MYYSYRFFNESDLPVIHQAFLKAFADYLVDTSYMTQEVLGMRAIKNGIDFDLSIGSFYGSELIGFTLTGIDYRKGVKSAFDIVTGIVKDHRGKGLAKEMFNQILEKSRTKNIDQFILEVIQENASAIKAYEKSDFKIERELTCFQIERENFPASLRKTDGLEIVPNSSSLYDYNEFLDWEPSWENSLNSISRIPDRKEIFTAYYNKKAVGFIVYYPLLNWIMSLAVDKSSRRKGIGSHLLNHVLLNIDSKITSVKILNVDGNDKVMHNFLISFGFKTITSQYEMIKPL